MSTKPIHCPSGERNGALRRAQSSEWRWLELIQCAHEELVAVGSDPFVDDVCTVPRDRQVDAHLVHEPTPPHPLERGQNA